jgi:hypothetical protein
MAPPRQRLGSASDGAHALSDDAGGYLEIRRDSVALDLVTEDHWLDALVFSGSACLVERVIRTC